MGSIVYSPILDQYSWSQIPLVNFPFVKESVFIDLERFLICLFALYEENLR